MAADKRVRAPYNFIPLSEKVLLPYNSIEELPPHDRMDPALKTGEIHVSMVADTPVFVSDGDKNEPHFFRGNNGKYMIPGSTIRGMVRENMQILGGGGAFGQRLYGPEGIQSADGGGDGASLQLQGPAGIPGGTGLPSHQCFR